jgi:hypothetical protein
VEHLSEKVGNKVFALIQREKKRKESLETGWSPGSCWLPSLSAEMNWMRWRKTLGSSSGNCGCQHPCLKGRFARKRAGFKRDREITGFAQGGKAGHLVRVEAHPEDSPIPALSHPSKAQSFLVCLEGENLSPAPSEEGGAPSTCSASSPSCLLTPCTPPPCGFYCLLPIW